MYIYCTCITNQHQKCFPCSTDDIFLLKCLLCGGYTDSLQDSVMWFSNGGTKSVLHFDAIDNINCLISGTKELFMVDKVYTNY